MRRSLKIVAVLEKNPLDAIWLELEITESSIMDDTIRTVQVLADLDSWALKFRLTITGARGIRLCPTLTQV